MTSHGGHTTRRSGRRAGALLTTSITTSITTSLAALLATGALAAPAHAEARVVPDAGGDDDSRTESFGELAELRVDYGQGRLRVRFVPAEGAPPGDVYDLYVDTDGDGEPERRVRYDRTVFPRGADAYRADGFSPAPSGAPVACDVGRRDFGGDRAEEGQIIVLLVPGECLGKPRELAVTAVTSVKGQGQSDWTPAPRRFSEPIARGSAS